VVASQYEALRAAAVGQALPLGARSGLALLLRRGMWGWARALAPAAAEQPICRSSPKSTVACQHSVIQILATMAMNTNDRRTV